MRYGRLFSEQTLEYVVPGRLLVSGNQPGLKLAEGEERTRNAAEGYENIVKLYTKMAIAQQGWERSSTKPIYIVLTINIASGLSRMKKADRENAWKGRKMPTLAPSAFKYVDIVKKCLKGLVFEKDNQIVGILAVKRYTKEPGLELLIGVPETWRELNHDLRNS